MSRDRAAIERMMQGVAAVVYMTGVGGDYTLEDLFRVNVARHVRRVRGGAARRRAAHRVRLSNHAFGCYPIEERVSPALPPRPDSLYGTFKAWGETMLRCYFDRHGIRSVSLRIGTYRTLPIDQRSLATWLSPGDVARLVDASLRHPDPGCLVVNGYSNNTRIKTFDPNWEFLGYRPQDNAEDHREMLRGMGVDVDGPWEWPEHGGSHARAPRSVRRGAITRNRGQAWSARSGYSPARRRCCCARRQRAPSNSASPARSRGSARCRSWSRSTRASSRNRGSTSSTR